MRHRDSRDPATARYCTKSTTIPRTAVWIVAMSIASLAAGAPHSRAAEPAAFELLDGDRVVWVGGALVERMQAYDYTESMLTLGYPGRRITFRNLGWSGDTVFGEARAVFGSTEDGFQRLLKDVRETSPTVLLVAYGNNEAHAGPDGLDAFTGGLKRLLEELAKIRSGPDERPARLVLLLPRDYEEIGPPLPSPAAYNKSLAMYRERIQAVATERNLPTVDLNAILPAGERLTENGVHFTEAGYARFARPLAEALGARPPADLQSPTDFERIEPLRTAIRKKNEFYFHRHRPQNETYLFLFRRHEQGNNAVEIPQFDPLVEKQEAEIAKLRDELLRGKSQRDGS